MPNEWWTYATSPEEARQRQADQWADTIDQKVPHPGMGTATATMEPPNPGTGAAPDPAAPAGPAAPSFAQPSSAVVGGVPAAPAVSAPPTVGAPQIVPAFAAPPASTPPAVAPVSGRPQPAPLAPFPAAGDTAPAVALASPQSVPVSSPVPSAPSTSVAPTDSAALADAWLADLNAHETNTRAGRMAIAQAADVAAGNEDVTAAYGIPRSAAAERQPANADVATDATGQPRTARPFSGDLTAGYEEFGNPQLARWLQDNGIDPGYTNAVCGPIAVAGTLRAYGIDANPGAVTKKARDMGEWNGAMLNGSGVGVQHVLKAYGLDSQVIPASNQAVQQAIDTINGGTPVILNFPNHYMLAQKYDPDTGKFFVGATGSNALKGGGDWMTLGQMNAAAGNMGSLRSIVVPTTAAPASETGEASAARAVDRSPQAGGRAQAEEPIVAAPDTSSHENFVRSVMPVAKYYESKYGIPAEVLIAINASESGWGGSGALFGIMGGNGPLLNTHEYINGRNVATQSRFRSYNTVNDAYEDFFNLVQHGPNEIYAPHWAQFKKDGDWRKFLVGIQRAGYATAPDWGDPYIPNVANSVARLAGTGAVASNLGGPSETPPGVSATGNTRNQAARGVSGPQSLSDARQAANADVAPPPLPGLAEMADNPYSYDEDTIARALAQARQARLDAAQSQDEDRLAAQSRGFQDRGVPTDYASYGRAPAGDTAQATFDPRDPYAVAQAEDLFSRHPTLPPVGPSGPFAGVTGTANAGTDLSPTLTQQAVESGGADRSRLGDLATGVGDTLATTSNVIPNPVGGAIQALRDPQQQAALTQAGDAVRRSYSDPNEMRSPMEIAGGFNLTEEPTAEDYDTAQRMIRSNADFQAADRDQRQAMLDLEARRVAQIRNMAFGALTGPETEGAALIGGGERSGTLIGQGEQAARQAAGRVVDAAGNVVGGAIDAVRQAAQPAMRRFYHGTGMGAAGIDASRFDDDALVGPAYYLTSSPEVAGGIVDQSGNVVRKGYALAGTGSQAAPNVRAVDIPPDLRLLDFEAPIGDRDIVRVGDALEEARQGAGSWLLSAMPFRPKTGQGLWESIVESVSPSSGSTPQAKALANRVLSASGFDGIRYPGGMHQPLTDAAGKPILHDALAIFPESLPKIRNALSGASGGAGSAAFEEGAHYWPGEPRYTPVRDVAMPNPGYRPNTPEDFTEQVFNRAEHRNLARPDLYPEPDPSRAEMGGLPGWREFLAPRPANWPENLPWLPVPKMSELRRALQIGRRFTGWYGEVAQSVANDVRVHNLMQTISNVAATSPNSPWKRNFTTGEMITAAFRLAEDPKVAARIRKLGSDFADAEPITTAAVQRFKDGSVMQLIGGGRGKPLADMDRSLKTVWALINQRATGVDDALGLEKLVGEGGEAAFAMREGLAKIANAAATGTMEIKTGAKISSFSQQFRNSLAGLFDPWTTQDVHQANIFGTKASNYANDDWWYRTSHAVTARLAREFDMEFKAAQAALWVVSRMISEGGKAAAREVKTPIGEMSLQKAYDLHVLPLDEILKEAELAGVFDEGFSAMREVKAHPSYNALSERLRGGDPELAAAMDKTDALLGSDYVLEHPGMTLPKEQLGVRRFYEGQAEAPRPPVRPVNRAEEARLRALGSLQAPAVLLPIPEQDLARAGYDAAKRAFSSIDVPHTVTDTPIGKILSIPNYGATAIRDLAATLSEQLGIDTLRVHIPDPSLQGPWHETGGGFVLTGTPEQLRNVSGLLRTAGVASEIAPDGNLLRVPRFGPTEEMKGTYGILARAADRVGLDPASIADYAGEVIEHGRQAARGALAGDVVGQEARVARPSGLHSLWPFDRPVAGEAEAQAPRISGGAGSGSEDLLAPQTDQPRSSPGQQAAQTVQSAIRRFYHGTHQTFPETDRAVLQGGSRDMMAFGDAYHMASDPELANRFAIGAPGDRKVQPVGAQLRAINVPSNLNLLDTERRYSLSEVGSRVAPLIPEGPSRNGFLMRLERVDRTNPGKPGVYGADIYDELTKAMGGRSAANRVLAQAGYDGIEAPGERLGLTGMSGTVAKGTELAIFPESLGKIRNALSGKAGGAAGVVPAIRLGGAAAGAGIGYETSPEGASPQEIAARTAGGAALGLTASTLATSPALRKALGDGFSTYMISNLLSAPSTHIKNVVGTAVNLALHPAETMLSSAADPASRLLTGQIGRQRFGISELSPMAAGMWQGMVNGIAAVPSIMAHGTAGGAFGVAGTLHELPGGALNLLNQNLRALGAEDAVLGGMAKSQALRVAAFRDGAARGLKGQALSQYVDNALLIPTADLVKQAQKDTEYLTFRQQGDRISRTIQELRKIPYVGPVLFPFVNGPWNVLKYGLERSPAAGVPIALDLMKGKYHGTQAVAHGDLSDRLARFMLGMGFTGLAYAMYQQGLITGVAPTDPQKRQLWEKDGNVAYSMNLGNGRHLPFMVIPAIGPSFMMTATALDALKNKDDNATAKAEAAFEGITAALREAPFLQSLGQVLDLVNAGKQGTSPVDALNKIVASAAPGMIPESAVLNRINQATDPYVRQAQGPLGRMQNVIPGLSQQLPPRLVGGQPVERPKIGVAESLVSPFTSRADTSTEATRELERLDTAYRGAGTRVGGVDLTPEQRAEYDRIYGNLQRVGVEEIQGTPRYQSANDAEKLKMTQSVEADAGRRARDAVMREFAITPPRDPDEPFRYALNQLPGPMRTKYADSDAGLIRLEQDAAAARSEMAKYNRARAARLNPPRPSAETIRLAALEPGREWQLWSRKKRPGDVQAQAERDRILNEAQDALTAPVP